MKRINSSAIMCDCGSIVPDDVQSCATCGANISRFVEANFLGVSPEPLSKEIICSWCKQSCEHHRKKCPDCGHDPLAIKCDCGSAWFVRFGQDVCFSCGKS